MRDFGNFRRQRGHYPLRIILELRMKTHHPSVGAAKNAAMQRGFTLVELLVAIAIIIVLVGILLPALGKVSTRAKATSTSATMNEFGKACDVFYTQFGYYPGIVPESYLANTTNCPISGTENALLHLMGGAVRQDDPEYDDLLTPPWTVFTFTGPTGSVPPTISIKVNRINIGKGPRIEGKQYESFFTPKDSQLRNVAGQVGETLAIPDLIDAWGHPIGYIRSSRPTGVLTRINASENPQFYLEPLLPYLNSPSLGEFGIDQATNSVFSTATVQQRGEFLAQLIRHPSMGSFALLSDARAGTPRGKYFLFSPGQDGLFFAKFGDGPMPTLTFNFASPEARKPDVVTTYNDIVISGGG